MHTPAHFRADAKHAQDVIHPNICRLLGVSTDGPKRCLVLEMCPAGALYGVLKADRAKLAAGAALSTSYSAPAAHISRTRQRFKPSVETPRRRQMFG